VTILGLTDLEHFLFVVLLVVIAIVLGLTVLAMVWKLMFQGCCEFGSSVFVAILASLQSPLEAWRVESATHIHTTPLPWVLRGTTDRQFWFEDDWASVGYD
jgi:hypothetical protein